jgi:hypothetical protein
MLGKFDEKCRNARAALMTRHGLNKARGPFQTPCNIMTEKQQKDSIIAAAERSLGGPLVVINQCQNPFSEPPETHSYSLCGARRAA